MLIFVTAWFMVGLLAGSYARFFPLGLLVSLILLGLALVRGERRGRLSPPQGMSAYAVVLAGVVYWVFFTVVWHPDAPLVLQQGESVAIRGRVVAPVQVTADRARMVIELILPGAADSATSIPGLLRLTWRYPDHSVYEGDTIEATVRVRSPQGTHNPGGFDVGAYLRRQGIVGIGTVSGPGAVTRIESGHVSWRWTLWTSLDEWRQRIAGAASASLDAQAAGLFLSLVTGDQALIDSDVRDGFVATGTVHILSISGSHLGLLAVCIFWCVRTACRWLPIALLLRLNRTMLTPTRVAILLTAPFVLGYALLAGAEVATTRALWMIGLCLVALWIGRERLLSSLVAASALVMLLLDPQVLYDVSFQLSYGSVLAIALVTEARSKADSEPAPLASPGLWQGRAKRLQQAFMLSLIVTAVTVPLVALHFHQLPWLSPVANLLLIPLAGVLVPLCLLSSVWVIVAHSEALAFPEFLQWVLWGMTKVVSLLAQIPLVDWHLAAPSVLTILTYYGVLLVIRRTDSSAVRGVGVVCLVVLVGWWAWPHRTLPPDRVRVTMVDVGQGDATVLELPGGETVLIDAGAQYERFDAGAGIVGPILWDRGITHLDHVIGTHPQLDHVGGVPWVLRHFPVGRYWGNGIARAESFYQDLQAALAERQLREQIPQAGEILAHSGPCRLVALTSPADGALTVSAHSRTGRDLNNASVMTRLQCGAHAMLFPGDTETVGLQRQLSEPMTGGATILKVPHHGARSSLFRPWLEALRPRIAIISAGRHNQYHHPHPDVLAAYAAQNVTLFRTDRDGAVTVTASLAGTSFTITTARQLEFEPVSFVGELWGTERRNLSRLCRRTFEDACPFLG